MNAKQLHDDAPYAIGGITERELDRLQAERDQAVRTFLQFADTCPPKPAEAAAEIDADDPTGWAWLDHITGPMVFAAILATGIPFAIGLWQIGRLVYQFIQRSFL